MNLLPAARFSLVLAVFPLTALALTPSQLFEKVKGSVVVIKALDAQGKALGQGSGVLLPSGKIATNCHVVRNGVRFQVGRDKSFVTATLHGGDADKDVCLLQADTLGGTPAQLGTATALKVGEAVYAVGAPQGLELSLSNGIVSQLRGGPPPFIQTTAAISPGSSGGGLFNSEGLLVGLTTLYIDGGQSLNFALPVEWLVDIKVGKKVTGKQRSEVDWFTRAVGLEEKKNWPKLLDWCEQWGKAYPDSPTAWLYIGIAHYKLNQLAPAIEAYRQALRINPEDSFSLLALGHVYANLQRYDEAIESYRQVLRINPEYVFVWYALGSAYQSLQRYDEAINAYRQALRISPDDLGAWFSLGFTYATLQRYDDAIDAYRQALRINPEFVPVWNNLGDAYGKLNRHDDAIDAYRQALRINPEDASAWSNLGSTYKDLKRYDDAISALRQALRINPAEAASWANLAITYYLTDDTPAALQAVKSLRPLAPELADKLFNLIVPR